MVKKFISVSAFVMLFASCKDEYNIIIKEDDNIKPRTNADGNYNIILITADQERYMDEYPVGSDYKAREKLRQLGTTFEKHYSCSNVSTSSRSVIYTGTHITNTLMLDNTNYVFQNAMSKDILTVGKMMQDLGYYSAYKGKWHLGKEGSGDQTNALVDYGFRDWGSEGDAQGAPLEGYTEDKKISAQACHWIERKGTELNNDGKSFFLALNFVNPHDVMYFKSGPQQQQGEHIIDISEAPKDPLYAKTYPLVPITKSWNEPIDAPGRVKAHMEYFQNWNSIVGTVPSREDSWERFRDYYFNCIQDCDNEMNKVIDLLQKKGMLNNTIIIMTSDHGEMLGAHGIRGKGGFMYEENIHVPLIIYHPEYKGNRRCKSVTSHIDITPTILDMTNNSSKNTMLSILKGYSLKPLVQDTHRSVRDKEGALFVFDMISMIDGDFQSTSEGYKIDINNRGFVRGIITSEYKFARYFSPVEFNTPTNIDDLYSRNDVEMFRINDYWGVNSETENLAADKKKYENIIMDYNTRLNNLINREIGFNDGRETDAYPGGIWNYAKQKK